jgi:hypothetical protein
MKIDLRALVAMLVGLAIAPTATPVLAQAPGQVPAGYAYYNEDPAAAEQASVEPMAVSGYGCETGACGGACGGACDGGCGMGGGLGPAGLGAGGLAGRSGQAFFGADWLHVRADVSDSTAFVERDITNLNAPTDTFHQTDFDYNSSYRFFGGYRFTDCCGEVLLTYTRFRSEALMTSPDATATRQFNAPFEVNAITPGSRLTIDVDIDADVYDVDFGRTLPLGSPLGDCCPNWCPAWDIQWFFGGRYADIDWTRDSVTTDPNAITSANISSRSRMSFDGAGPRFGINGRRYFGSNGNFSVFAKGAISVLLGDVDYVTTAVSATPGVVPTQLASFTRLIPVTEIEVGGSVHLSENLTISGGYLFSAWHDLGFGDQYFATLTPVFYDDANILGFDAAFLRAEVAY